MSKEYEIMEHLHTEEVLSQRKIAEKTGLSLGMVNILLQRMVKKGLVKIERLNARSLRYILTPQGLAEKSKLTYSYIKASYNYISKQFLKVREIIDQAKDFGVKHIYLYGPKNEVYHIIKLALDPEKIPFTYINDLNTIPKAANVIVWELADEEKLADDYQVINILKVI